MWGTQFYLVNSKRKQKATKKKSYKKRTESLVLVRTILGSIFVTSSLCTSPIHTVQGRGTSQRRTSFLEIYRYLNRFKITTRHNTEIETKEFFII